MFFLAPFNDSAVMFLLMFFPSVTQQVSNLPTLHFTRSPVKALLTEFVIKPSSYSNGFSVGAKRKSLLTACAVPHTDKFSHLISHPRIPQTQSERPLCHQGQLHKERCLVSGSLVVLVSFNSGA